MFRSEHIFLPIYPVTPNHTIQKGFPAKFCSIFALSARICRFWTAAFELEYFCLCRSYVRFALSVHEFCAIKYDRGENVCPRAGNCGTLREYLPGRS